MYKLFKIIYLSLILSACAELPQGIEPVHGFEAERYTGKWYEIARLDNRFERGLDRITAEYTLNKDGGLNVTNSGRNVDNGIREYAHGKAYFTQAPDVGSLKVSFFGPFYGGYHIIELDKERYSYVMIAGSDRDYLWILAREPKLEQAVLQNLINKAKKLGFATDQLIYPAQ